MDDRIDHRVERQVKRGRHLFEFEGVPEQNVQKLVDEDGFDLFLGLAMTAHEPQVYLQDARLAQGDGEGFDRAGKVDAAKRENRPASQRVLVDRLLQERTEVVLVNPHRSSRDGAG